MSLLSGPDSTEKAQLWMDQYCERARISDGEQEENAYMRYIYMRYIESGNYSINVEVSMYYYLRKLSRWQSKKIRPPKAGFHQFWPQKKFIFCQSWFEKSLDSCVLNGDSECQVRFQTQIFICNNEKWKNGHTSHAKKHQWEFYPVPLLLG